MQPTPRLLCCAILAILCIVTHGARKVHVKKRFSYGMGRYATWRMRRQAGETVTEPSTEELLDLQPGEHLTSVTSITTAKGTTMKKLAETYQDIPVFGQSVVIETDNGELTGAISGHLVEGIEEDIPNVTPSLNEADAVSVAATSLGHNLGEIDPESIQITLEVYVQDPVTGDEVITFLAYAVSYFIIENDTPSRPSFIMDANSGRIVRQWEGLTSKHHPRTIEDWESYEFSAVGGNVKMGKNTYGDRLPALDIRMVDGICYLENNKVSVVDMRSDYSYYYDYYDYDYNATSPANVTDERRRSYDHYTMSNDSFSFPCDQGFNDSVNGAYSPMADAFFYGCMTYDLFMEWVGVEPLNFKMVLAVHVGHGMDNAYWDGRRASFGDGADYFYPLTTLDTVSHEVAHGFTEQNSGLIYSGQSGGMNEAYSDISGRGAEQYVKMTEWLDGHDMMKEGDALRYFTDPTLDGRSIGDANQFCPELNVHYSSGVFNHAFYLLSTTEGWTVRMAFQAFTVANQLYWTPDSSFDAGACGVEQAASDLGFNSEDVVNAFLQVGVNGCNVQLTGLDLLHGLNAVENETLTFVFILEADDLDLLRFETYTSSYWSGDYLLHVQTPHRNLSSHSQEDIHVMRPPSGTYIVSLTPTEDSFTRTDLYAITGQTVLGENFEFDNYTLTANGSFYLPEEVVAAGLPIAIRTIAHNNDEMSLTPFFMITYEGEVDVARRIGQLTSCMRYNQKKYMYEAFIRTPRSGEYNYQLSFNPWDYEEALASDSLDSLQLVMETQLFPVFPE